MTAVLVHGVGLDRQMWAPFASALAMPTLAIDMLGHGDAPAPPRHGALSHFAAAVAAAIEHLDEGPVDVVGFSMGALVAQRLAVDRPTLVRRLVLVSTVYDRTPDERAAIVARAAAVRAGGYLASIEPALERWFTPEFAASRPDVVDAVRSRLLANDVSHYASAYEVFATGDAELVALVDRITAPTLVVTGADDPRSTPLMTESLAAALPDGWATVVPNVRHLLPLEQPDTLAALVREFLSRPEPPSPTTASQPITPAQPDQRRPR